MTHLRAVIVTGRPRWALAGVLTAMVLAGCSGGGSSAGDSAAGCRAGEVREVVVTETSRRPVTEQVSQLAIAPGGTHRVEPGTDGPIAPRVTSPAGRVDQELKRAVEAQAYDALPGATRSYPGSRVTRNLAPGAPNRVYLKALTVRRITADWTAEECSADGEPSTREGRVVTYASPRWTVRDCSRAWRPGTVSKDAWRDLCSSSS